ncbi:hypothetical protein [Pseudofrankia inefficax]|uniref:Uncharacterized protein n=1 Tax=Pseudofrankia inefficax (strain DSM 45817 / CECT 9037 / DDB 130130 / EuI1c) TaxID=298654 RepID=E3IX29_PSEI1|nr:hypothetical protein [Pseudofrankia inefficax]ADP83801.1 hypothetical protein FraEuI1c_5817 [Pseudofrankia inefficax]
MSVTTPSELDQARREIAALAHLGIDLATKRERVLTHLECARQVLAGPTAPDDEDRLWWARELPRLEAELAALNELLDQRAAAGVAEAETSNGAVSLSAAS